MSTIQDIRDVFSTLHDGTISAWAGDKEVLILTIDCEYLAERIDKSFSTFYVELYTVDKVEFDPWMTSVDLPAIVKTGFNTIFEEELEILSAEIKDYAVVVYCDQHNTDLDYCGGTLTIRCQRIKVFDQNRRELTVDQLCKTGSSYWSEASRK